MRVILFALASVLSQATVAQEVLKSTKADSIVSAGSSGGGSAMPLLQVVVALLIVGGIVKVILPKMIPNLKSKFTNSLGSSIAIEETASFQGGQLMVIKARGRSFLIGATPQAVNVIAELTESEKAANAEPAFFELIDQKTSEVQSAQFTHAVVDLAAEEDPGKKTAKLQLERLRRLIGS